MANLERRNLSKAWLSSLRLGDWLLRLGDGIQWEGGGPSDHDAGPGEGQAMEGGPSSRRNRVFLLLSSRFCILLVKYIYITYFGGLKSILLSIPYLDVIAPKNEKCAIMLWLSRNR